jgi:hypothetical protein
MNITASAFIVGVLIAQTLKNIRKFDCKGVWGQAQEGLTI